MDEFHRVLDEVRQEIIYKVIAIPGYAPIGRVIKVDEQGAWLEKGGRIAVEGLVFYHPVRDL
jgi:hypothetical protein